MDNGELILLVAVFSCVSCTAQVDDSELTGAATDDGLVQADEIEATQAEIAKYAADPEYEKVPGFLMHRSCVHEVPDGAMVRKLADGTLKVRRTANDAEEDLPRCSFPSIRMKRPDSALPATISHSWIEYTGPLRHPQRA